MRAVRSAKEEPGQDTRRRILDAALRLTQAEGPEAATTRAVAAAASVQVPTIYRFFGDKEGLLDAVAEHGLAAYVATKKQREPNPDPVQELRLGWQSHVAFGLANPALFSIMSNNPRSPAAAEGHQILKKRVQAIARVGRLRTSAERAVAILHAACVGLVLTMVAEGKTEVSELSNMTFDAIISAITVSSVKKRVLLDQKVAAATLRATLDPSSGLSKGELGLLDELLERLANGSNL